MTRHSSKHIRVLGITASSRGIGFAVMDGKNVLVDWGVKTVEGDKNARSLSNVANLIDHYEPDAIVLENTRSEGSRRRPRVQALTQEIVALAESENIEVKQFSRKQLNLGFITDRPGTKQALAEYIAARFPDELGFRLPKKRRPWMNEDSRMDIFDAVALAEHFLRSRE
jgi:RNase H-fold protein (predicted Holliday junction resolvase)